MSVEYFDKEQGIEVTKLEETMVIDDDSYFITMVNNLVRKINLLSLIKACIGDDANDNREYKFYSTKYIDEQIKQITFQISSLANQFDDYDEKIEKIKTQIDVSLKNFQSIIGSIDPKLEKISKDLQEYVDKHIVELKNEDSKINLRVEEIYKELSDADKAIISDYTKKFEQITGVIDNKGNITDVLYNNLKNQIDSLTTLLDQYYTELKANDTALNKRIDDLKNTSDNTNKNLTENFYNKTDIDSFIKDIYDRIKVQIISSPTMEDGSAVDIDNFLEDGLYFFTQTANAKSLPDNCTNGMLHVINYGGSGTQVVKQIFYRYGTINISDHQMYTRTRFTNSSWSEFARVLTDKDIIYGTKVPTNLQNGQIYIQYFV